MTRGRGDDPAKVGPDVADRCVMNPSVEPVMRERVRIGQRRRQAGILAFVSVACVAGGSMPGAAQVSAVEPGAPRGGSVRAGDSGAWRLIRLEDQKCSFEIPSGWSDLPGEHLGVLNDSAAGAAGEGGDGVDFRFVFGATGGGASAVVDGDAGVARGVTIPRPSVLVQTTERLLTGATYEDVERSFNAVSMRRAAGELSDRAGGAIEGVRVGESMLDRVRNRVVTRLEVRAQGTPVRVTAVTFLGRSRTVQMNFYEDAAGGGDADGVVSRADDSGAAGAGDDGASGAPSALLQGMVDSFRFDAGEEFVTSGRGAGIEAGSGTSGDSRKSGWGGLWRVLVLAGVSSGIVGVIAVLKRRAKAPSFPVG